ncbi:Chlorophyll a/b binding protein domain [Ostreococcus tauri]|uniref:Chlorophyll a/b binding protein domain n=2 Tax=Ostreococcus tauri TaxID=70448 RepID=A0A090M1Y0_OSTTA|nr:Chlorophyll a/b binding protein domain [Ostreococcus tauri]CEF98240.1 Chlorophyll a/b binding protein domain [Ostreococcus tauri]|eukprot:XP_022839157.1 Chlorophyll a/b binding protein domain [Ostreococcus tauri]
MRALAPPASVARRPPPRGRSVRARAAGDDAARRARARADAPEGVPPPPFAPTIEPATFGFVENAERANARASMVGWWALLLVEAVAGKGILELAGVTVGKGINFTF